MICRYVIEKRKRVPGEPFDIDEDVDNFDIQIQDYAEDDDEMEEEEEEEENGDDSDYVDDEQVSDEEYD